MTDIVNRGNAAHKGYHNHLLNSSFLKQKIDLANIPHSLKDLIMDQSIQRLKEYSPQKCTIRSEQKITTLNTKELIEIKKKRMHAVYNRGFLSDPKDHYRPLGDPYVDTEMLLYDNLQLDVKTLLYCINKLVILSNLQGKLKKKSPNKRISKQK